MKTIIAGSRSITDESFIFNKLFEYTLEHEITEVICGGAKGVDSIGKKWAEERNIPVKLFIPDWDNLYAPGAVIRTGKYGSKYNAKAGLDRNTEMARYGDALVAFWDKKSNGTNDMIGKANMLGLNVCIYLMDDYISV